MSSSWYEHKILIVEFKFWKVKVIEWFLFEIIEYEFSCLISSFVVTVSSFIYINKKMLTINIQYFDNKKMKLKITLI